MSRPEAKPSEKSGSYHHGDLRRALINAARVSLKEKGIDKLSLREVARNTGVSHAAAYHHFRDKTSLVAAVAVTTFSELESVMQRAFDEQAVDAVARLRSLAHTYVEFALEHPDEFRLMFSPQLRDDTVLTEVEKAGRATYVVLIAALSVVQEEGRLATDNLERAAITVWAQVHGLASLMLDGPLYRNAQSEAGREALIAASVEGLLTGVLNE